MVFDGTLFKSKFPILEKDTSHSHSSIIGNGVDNEYTIVHNLNTRNVVVTVIEATSPFNFIKTEVRATTVNSVKISFSHIPSANSRQVFIQSAGDGKEYSQTIGDGSSTEFTVIHNLGFFDTFATVRKINSPYEYVVFEYYPITKTKAKLVFSSPPDSNSLTASFYAPLKNYSYKKTVGNSTDTTFQIEHNLDTKKIHVFCRDKQSPYVHTVVGWNILTDNSIQVDFEQAPSNDSKIIYVFSSFGADNEPFYVHELLDVNVSSLQSDDVLSWNHSSQKWINSKPFISSTIVNAKGDLIAATADDTPARLAVGANDTVLMARSSESTGLAYGAPRLAGGAGRPLLTGGCFLDGSTGLVFGGVGGNVATTPDSAALSITGDIDIKVYATLPDWTPASSTPFVSKYGETSTRSYVFSLLSDGRLRFIITPDGTTGSQLDHFSTVATGITDGTPKWIRVTCDVDNGSSQRVVKFYTSDNGTTWTQLGDTITAAGATSIYDGPDELAIGSQTNYYGGAQLIGTIGRVIIQSGFDNANNTTNVRFDANFATQAADTMAFTESSSNAATVSIFSDRYTYGLPDHSFYTRTTFGLTANFQYYMPFKVTQPITVDMTYFRNTTPPASTTTVRTGIYASDNDFQPGALIVDAGNTTVTTSSNTNYFSQFSPVTLQPGVYLVTMNTSAALTVIAWGGGYMAVTIPASDFIITLRVSQTQGALPNPGTKWNSINAGSAANLNFVLLRWRPA